MALQLLCAPPSCATRSVLQCAATPTKSDYAQTPPRDCRLACARMALSGLIAIIIEITARMALFVACSVTRAVQLFQTSKVLLSRDIITNPTSNSIMFHPRVDTLVQCRCHL